MRGWAPTLALGLLVAGCGGDEETSSTPSAAEVSGTSSSSETTQSPETSSAESDLNEPVLVVASERPGDVAAVVSFYEGGDTPCFETGEPLTTLVALPGFHLRESAELGWSNVVCITDDTAESPLEAIEATVQGPDGFEASARFLDDPGEQSFELHSSSRGFAGSVGLSSGTVTFNPMRDAPTGAYDIRVLTDQGEFTRTITVERATTERIGFLRLPDYELPDPSQPRLQFFGFAANSTVPLAIYEQTEAGEEFGFFSQLDIEVDDQGEAEVVLSLPSSSARCWTVVADPAEDHSNGDGGNGLHFGDAKHDNFCS